MRNKTNLDERQLWQRGNVFKHGFVFLLAALAAQGSARPAASPGPRAPGRRSCSFGAAWPCAGGSSYSGNLSRGEEPEGVLLRHGPVWGVHRGDGAGLLGGRGAARCWRRGRSPLRGATTLIGCLMASILGAHLGKTAWDKRHPPEDEE